MLTTMLLLGPMAASPSQAQTSTHDLRVGDKAPHFMVQTLDGDRVTLGDLNPGGPVFLYFIHEGDTTNVAPSSYIHRIIGTYAPSKAKW